MLQRNTRTRIVVIDHLYSCILYSFGISIFATATLQQINSCSTIDESVGLAEGMGREGPGLLSWGDLSVDLPVPEDKHSSYETPLTISVLCLYVRSLLDDSTLGYGCTDLGRQVAPCICGSSVWNLQNVSFLAPIILRKMLDSLKSCAPVRQRVKILFHEIFRKPLHTVQYIPQRCLQQRCTTDMIVRLTPSLLSKYGPTEWPRCWHIVGRAEENHETFNMVGISEYKYRGVRTTTWRMQFERLCLCPLFSY
jgi:hypothetical protein